MALQKLLHFSIFLAFIFSKFASAGSSITAGFEEGSDTVSQANETGIEEKIHEIRSKDQRIKLLEKIAEEKSNSLASLRSQVRLLQGKGSLDAKELVAKVDEQASKLERQIVNLKKEIEGQNKKADELEVGANVAEKKIDRVNLKIEDLRRINDEQRSLIRKAEYALQVAEEEMLKAKLEASSISQPGKEVPQELLPWLSAHFVYFKAVVAASWKEQVKPALDLTIEQALEKLKGVEKWAHPHFETFKTKWIPAIKECCIAFVSDIKPRVKSIASKAFNYYLVTMETLEPLIMEIQEVMDPYFQEAKRLSMPYIDHVSRIAKPQVDKVCVFLKPYTTVVFRSYKQITRNLRICHFRLQERIHNKLNSYEFTEPLGKEELVWLMATILMVLPGVVFFRIILRKKPKKRTHKTHSGQTRRRVKRT